MMTQWRQDFQWRGPVETCSRSGTEARGEGVQLALGVARPVGALGPVLAQQPSGIFVGAAWPRAVRIRNEDPDREPLCQALVLSPLVASIVGQSVAQQGGHVPEPVRAPVAGTPHVYPRKPGQENPARGPLPQGADGRAIACPLEKVAVPVAGHREGGHVCGALGTGRHVGELAASVGPPRPRPARLTQRDPAVRDAGFPRGNTDNATSMASAERGVRLSSGYALRRRPANCSGEQPRARCVQTSCHSQGSRGVRGRRGWHARAAARVCALQARYGWSRACSRLTVLEARRNTVAIVRNDWP